METITYTQDANGNTFQVITTPVVVDDIASQITQLTDQISFYQSKIVEANKRVAEDTANYTAAITDAQAQLDNINTQIQNIPVLQPPIIVAPENINNQPLPPQPAPVQLS